MFLLIFCVYLRAAQAGTHIHLNQTIQGKVPVSVQKLLRAEPMDQCKFFGQPLPGGTPAQALWLVYTECEGSGGTQAELVSTSPSGAVKVLEPELMLDLELTDQQTHGMPGIVTFSGGECCGFFHRMYTFDGAKYRKTGERWQRYVLDLSVSVPDELLGALRTYTKGNACVQDALRDKSGIGGDYIGPTGNGKYGGFVVSSRCESNGGYPVWVIKPEPTPQVILSISVPDSDLVFGPQLGGLPDVCYADNDPKTDPITVVPTRCWHYDGKGYGILPKPYAAVNAM